MNIRPLPHEGALSARSTWPPQRRCAPGARGFTLIELMVVLAIMAVVVSITVGAFRSLTDNNQRTACQANLVQVYQGLRLYMADEGNRAPYFDPKAAAGQKNIGLWNLWTYPNPANADEIAPVTPAAGASYSLPTARYLRSTKVLHCPADVDSNAIRPNPSEQFTTAANDIYNPHYLSYQMYATNNINNPYSAQDVAGQDGIDAMGNGPDLTAYTYLPVRINALAAGATPAQKLDYKRQLLQRSSPTTFYKSPPLGNTIVTWCRHHRYTRDFDNVLFFDGSVQLIAREQDNFGADCAIDATTPVLTGSNRVPRRTDCGE